jgi:hypothetical protein
MSTNTDFDKIDKVLSKITGKELKSFVRIYSYTHDDFATALVEKYWKPEREPVRYDLWAEENKILKGIYSDKYYVKTYLGSIL